MTFDWPTTGNQNRLLELEADFLNNKLSHAYLFAGPSEIGKLTAAKFFARLILCENKACGECAICRQIKANIYPQLTVVDELWIEGVNEDINELAKKSNFNQIHRSKTPKAKTDTISIDDLREILARVNNTHEGLQVFVIHNIERLNRESANFFLKTLEEPPTRTIFLLTTNNLPLLIPTIISRCRILQFGNVKPSVIDAMLQKDFPDLDEKERSRVVNFSMGKPVRATRLASDPDTFREFSEYFHKLKNILEKPEVDKKMSFAEEASKNSKEIKKFLEAFTYFLRSFLLTRAKQPIQNSRYSAKKIVDLIRECNKTQALITKNVNPRLAVENLLLSI